MLSPWFQFKPAVASDSPITFPALIQCRYVVTRDTSGSFILREHAEGDEQADVTMAVDGNSNVTLAVGARSGIPVQVNDRVVELSKSMPLNLDDEIQLDGHKYDFRQLTSEISKLCERVKETIPCRCCKLANRDVRVLRCGHSLCGPCLNEKVRIAMTVPPNTDIHLPAGVAAAAEREEILQQMRTISCDACQQHFSCWEALKAPRSLSLSQIVPEMKRWVGIDEARPKCTVCDSTRCIVDVKDYEFCETCTMILCPVCAVENHRSHTFRDRSLVLKAMHEYGKVIAAKKIELSRLKKLEADLDRKTQANFIEFQRLMRQSQTRVQQAVTECDQMISQFTEKTSPLDNSSADMFNNFRTQLEQSTDQIKTLNAAADLLTKGLEETLSMFRDAK